MHLARLKRLQAALAQANLDGAVAIAAMTVGRNPIRLKTLIENFTRNIEVQIVESVTHVHKHAGVFGIADLGPQLTIAVEQAARMACEHMRDNIAGMQILQHVRDVDRLRILVPAFADVNQQRQP